MSLEIAIAENTRALQALLAHLQAQPLAAPAPAVEPAPKARKAKAEPAPVNYGEVVRSLSQPAPVVEAPVVEAPVVEAPVVEAAPAPGMTHNDLLAVLTPVIRVGKRDEVRALLAKVGAGKLTEVPVDRIAEVAAAARALLEV